MRERLPEQVSMSMKWNHLFQEIIPCLMQKHYIDSHIAFATVESFQKRAAIVFANIEKYLAGEPQNVIE